MKREFHVRFCERLEGEIPSCLLSANSSADSALKIEKFPGVLRAARKYWCKSELFILNDFSAFIPSSKVPNGRELFFASYYRKNINLLFA